jgi:hypothetical protein
MFGSSYRSPANDPIKTTRSSLLELFEYRPVSPALLGKIRPSGLRVSDAVTDLRLRERSSRTDPDAPPASETTIARINDDVPVAPHVDLLEH